MMEENLGFVDAALYVLDARAPRSCRSPLFDEMLAGKTTLFLLNKADMADPAANRRWLERYRDRGEEILLLNGTEGRCRQPVLDALKNALRGKIERNRAKGISLPLRAMVIGVPNSGKSTVINLLCGSKRAVTGDKPGVTRGKQWVRVDGGTELLDTPGTLWHSFGEAAIGEHLAYIGSIKEEVTDGEELSRTLINELKGLYPALLAERYGLSAGEMEADGYGILERIAERRGFLKKGAFDTERCAKAVLDDFKKARIGKITLELP
jgi:ribosome biogenesis GTPase A